MQLKFMRQWYLYQEIRPLCYDNKDITCPKPTVPKPEITIVEHVDKTRKCSYCYEKNLLQQVHSISLQISDIQHPLSLNWT
jgi:hypothetical protein